MNQDNQHPFAPVRLENRSGSAAVFPYGAHVTEYVPVGQQPVLWTSQLAEFESGKAIRGGIPVIWPWFGSHPIDKNNASHGIARKISWNPVLLAEGEVTKGSAQAKFQLLPTERSHPEVDGKFETTLLVTLSDGLIVSLTTKNLGDKPFNYSAALHSYFSVGDARKISIHGLDGRLYVDQLDNNARKTQSGPIVIDSEVDNIYLETADTVEIHDPILGRVIEIAKRGSLSTVVWNPWIDKAARMADFGNKEYLEMVCVETCNAADDSRQLQPGESHTLTTIISSRLI